MSSPTLKELIPSSPFVLLDELVHKNLESWSEELHGDLKGLDAQKENYILEVSPKLNQAALIASLKGNSGVASKFCHIQLKWLLDRSAHTHMSSNVMTTIFQPWINIGRLHIYGRDYEQALAYYGLYNKIRTKEPINLIYREFGYEELAEGVDLGEEGILLSFLHVNYVDGVFRMKVQNEDFLECHEFIEQQKENASIHLDDLLTECNLILWELMGSYKEALETIFQYRPKKIINKFFFQYHLALNYELSEKRELAKKYCSKLVHYLDKVLAAPNFVPLKKLVLQTAKLCKRLELYVSADALYQKGYEVSKLMEDQRYAILYVVGLYNSPIASTEEKAKWRRILLEEVANSEYRLPPALKLELGDFVKEGSAHKNFRNLTTFVETTFAGFDSHDEG